MGAHGSARQMLADYGNLRTIPALLSVFFVAASAYQFGGISELHIVWLDYTLTTEHAMLISLGTYAIAFASSQTKSFEHYEPWEQGAIAAGPILLVAHQYVDQVHNLIATEGHTGPVLAFLVAIVAWGVTVR